MYLCVFVFLCVCIYLWRTDIFPLGRALCVEHAKVGLLYRAYICVSNVYYVCMYLYICVCIYVCIPGVSTPSRSGEPCMNEQHVKIIQTVGCYIDMCISVCMYL